MVFAQDRVILKMMKPMHVYPDITPSQRRSTRFTKESHSTSQSVRAMTPHVRIGYVHSCVLSRAASPFHASEESRKSSCNSHHLRD